MIDKKYLKNIIIAKIGFFAKYFRVFRLLIIIIYLIFLEMLMLNIISSVEYIPSDNEVQRRFTPITAKNEVINSIEKYFLEKKDNLIRNIQRETWSNPFMPYNADESDSADSDIIPENNVIN